MNKRILFVDDEPRVLDALRRMLRSQRGVWDLIASSDPLDAWESLQSEPFDAVVSDISMPGMSGLQLLERIKQSDRLKSVPVVMLTGLDGRELKRRALDLGAADLLSKPVEPEDLVARLRSVLRLKAYEDELRGCNALLEERVRQRSAELDRSRMDVIWRLGKAAEHRDNETANHVIRVGCTSRIVAAAMGLDSAMVQTLFVAAPLHDIGKIGIPDAILMKRGPLSPEERKVMQRHCQIGARILREDAQAETAFRRWQRQQPGANGGKIENPMLEMAARVALMHHEKWDGSGYPQGLAGEKIALEARIVAICDVFDALTSSRPYRAPLPEHEALRIIHQTAGSHFDPQVYAAFRHSLGEIRAVGAEFADSGHAVQA